jgi:hypothetical protein
MAGWIKLHRSIKEWEWYSDLKTRSLFMHLLISVNWKDGNFRGKNIYRGQIVTSYSKLASESGLTFQNVRTCLKNLMLTGEVTCESTNDFTVVTLTNYGLYQSDSEEATSQVTSELTNDQQSTNTRTNNQLTRELTTIEEVKKVRSKEGKKVIIKKDEIDYTVLRLSQSYIDEIVKIRNKNCPTIKKAKLTQRIVNSLASEFTKAHMAGFSIEHVLTEWDTRGWQSFKADWLAKPNYNKPQLISQNSTRTRDRQIEQGLKDNSWAD